VPATVARFGPGSLPLWITRGDDVSYPQGLYTSYTSETVNTPLNITGRTYSSSVATARGGTVIVGATPTVVVTDAANGKILWSLTDTQTDLLTGPRYVWDLIENAGTTSERTLIVDVLNVSGRATP